MRTFHFAPLLVAVLGFAACRQAGRQLADLNILGIRTLSGLPSASGITARGSVFFVNSDNAPYLYVLDTAGSLKDSIPLLNEDPRLHEIPKPLKPDYEAAAVVSFQDRSGLLLLGSGTLSPHRDSALLVSVSQRKGNLRPFYRSLKIPEKALNIEAAARSGHRLMLFNRGTNEIITVHSDSFLNALFMAAPIPAHTIQRITLPGVQGYAPGISGACMLDDTTLMFCGSVEATMDWAKDGAILGSGIGVLHVPASGSARLLQWVMLTDAGGKLLPEKLEGIEVLTHDDRVVVVRCVTDNDNGSSGVLDLLVKRKAGISGHGR